jgi:hypothetical protein
MEIEVDFPTDLVVEMQESAVKKAKRTVIGRTLGGRATFKALFDCFKLHLPAPFNLVSLLTRGYFEIIFENEEGAKATRRLAAVEWSGLGLSFSRYIPNFDSSSQGAEAQLTHAIKVQFPDLHEQFRNTRAMTIMASKIGEVLEIEAVDSYIKRPAGPMITIDLTDISKLPGYIRIPSMAEGSKPSDTVAQRILYSNLPNQCKKCRRFGHHAQACTINRSKPWEGAPTYPPTNSRRSEGKEPGKGGIPQPNQAQANKQPQTQKGRRNQEQSKVIQNQKEDSKNTDYPAQRNITSTSAMPPNAEPATRNRCPKATSRTSESDQEMKEASEPSIQPESEAKTCVELLEEGQQKLDAIGNSTPNVGIQEPAKSPASGPAAQSNPFAILGDDNAGAASLMEAQEDLKEGWSFQGRKRLDPK